MAEKHCNHCGTDENGDNFAMQLLKEYSKTAKRWFIACMVVLIMWLSTIGAFVWFLNQFTFVSYDISTDGGGDAYYQNEIEGDIYNGENTSTKND